MTSWEDLEKQVATAAENVKYLKGGGAEKDKIDAAVAEMLSLKAAFSTALEAAIAATPDDATRLKLTAKLPPAPKGKDKKKDKPAAGATSDSVRCTAS